MKTLMEAHREAKRRQRVAEVRRTAEKETVKSDLRTSIEEAKTVKDLKAALLSTLDLLEDQPNA